jgi:hypothetical protein
MSAPPPQNTSLADYVPTGLIRRIQSHFRDKIEEAVQRYQFNEVDEDSLTGALGHALSTPQKIVSISGAATYSFGTPESRTGADGIFQLSVETQGSALFAKGLPFQAKKLSRFTLGEVKPQAADMYRTSGTGMVLRFSPKGYDAEDVRHMFPMDGEPIATPPGFNRLEAMLGDWFLQCKLGRIGLRFDRNEADPHVRGKRGYWVFDTRILKSGL